MLTPEEEKMIKDAEVQKQHLLNTGREYVVNRKEQQAHFQNLKVVLKVLSQSGGDIEEYMKKELGLTE